MKTIILTLMYFPHSHQVMAEPRVSSIDGRLAEEFAVPSHVDEVKQKMTAFAEEHAAAGRRVVLITSGGTKVPLESRTVRFLDNFSSGRRGASSAEYFIESGYAVIFLHRHRSLYPYARMFSTVNMLDALKFRGGEELPGNCAEVVVDQQVLPNIAKVLKQYQEVKESGLLLPIEFSTLSEYLHLLKAAAQSLSTIGKCCRSCNSHPHLMHLFQVVVECSYCSPRIQGHVLLGCCCVRFLHPSI